MAVSPDVGMQWKSPRSAEARRRRKLNGIVRVSENGRGKKNSLHRFVLFEECEALVLKPRRSKPVRGPRHNLLASELLDPRKAGRIDGGGATVDFDNIATGQGALHRVFPGRRRVGE